MKPPPRVRSKPNRYVARKVDSEQPCPLICTWKRTEQKQLLKVLKKVGDTVGSTGEIDYAFLRQNIPQRTVTQIRLLVEALKAKVITFVRHRVNRQRREEMRLKKPLDLWRDMASTMSGALEDTICAAFSQMFSVSSTEPCNLKHSDPPHISASNRLQPPGDRTIPFRPIPRPVVVPGGQLPGASSAARPPLLLMTPAPATGPAIRLLKTPAPVMGLATRPPAPSRVFRLVNATAPAPQPQPSTATPVPGPSQPQCPPNTSEAPSVSMQLLRQTATPPASPRVPVRQPPPSPAVSSTPSSPSVSVQLLCQTATPPASPRVPVRQPPPSPAISSTSSSPAVPSSPSSFSSSPASGTSTTASRSSPPTFHSSPSPTAALHARFGRTSKYAREDSPRVLGMKCIVDFEKIYQFLSSVHNEQEEVFLTAMESAVVLDLLMSLPEEIPLLDCNKLRRHMLKVHTELSAPATVPSELLPDQRSESQQDGTKVPQRSSQGPLQTQVGGGGVIATIATEESPGNPVQRDEAEGSVATGSAAAQPVDGQAQSQSPASGNAFTCKQEKPDWEQAGLRPLNPFMVPLKLLARRPSTPPL